MIVGKYTTPNLMSDLRLSDAWISNEVCDGVHYRKEKDSHAKKSTRYYIDENFDGLARSVFKDGSYYRLHISLIYYCADEKAKGGKKITCYVSNEIVDVEQNLKEKTSLIIDIDFYKEAKWTPAKIFSEAGKKLDEINVVGWSLM